MNIKQKSRQFALFICIALMSTIIFQITPAKAQVAGTEKRYIRIGSLQSYFSAYGSERAWNNSYYEGLVWPADYLQQDNAVIKRAWIAVPDFTNPEGKHYDYYGIYFARDEYVDVSLFPMELKQTAKFAPPMVYVDGNNISAIYSGDIDEINPDQIADRIVTNVVNTSMGLTQTRRIYAFSQQYHDNYFIKEFIFKNTGNTDYDDDIELHQTLKGVRIGWGIRYSVCREGARKIDGPQTWGQHTWVTKRGEDYPSHANEVITEANPIVEWIRGAFAWAGQSSTNNYDNIGAPDMTGNGRLCSPQHAGIGILHVDKSATDKSDDPYQPAVLGWHAGDTYPKLGDMSADYEDNMKYLYEMLSGVPYRGLGGTDRFDETYMATHPDPYTVHNDGGGTNMWICYGPFDLAPGDSITIVEVEAVNGLNRQLCEQIGANWKHAYDDPTDKGPFKLPDGSTTDDKDTYKDSWVYTGKDSIMLTFSRAKRNYDSGFQIPQPPLPPPVFEVSSGGDRIFLRWTASPSEDQSDFAGYKIYRAVGKPDTTYQKIYECSPGVTEFEDVTAIRGYSYYYYIVAVNNGDNNTSGELNPTGQLHSSRFYTRTTEPAFLRRKPGSKLDSIRIVPNPFNIRAKDFQYPGEADKIMFLNIPGHCTINIYTERGDLIETIHHEDGSGDHEWNSITSSRQVVVSGIYIAVFTVTQDYSNPDTGEIIFRKGNSTFKKFVIIR
ncbi:MAG: fibronectin [Calditrichaeota bacterium]|nr:fibronectin [Calditrichota bacterium]